MVLRVEEWEDEIHQKLHAGLLFHGGTGMRT